MALCPRGRCRKEKNGVATRRLPIFFGAQPRSNPGQRRQAMANEALPALERASQPEIRTPA